MRTVRALFFVPAIWGLVFLTVSCGTVPRGRHDAVVLPVYYATDRKALIPLDQWKRTFRKNGSQGCYYGGEYNCTNLELGVCPVSVPIKEHRVGEVERPGWFETIEHPGKHFAITALDPVGAEQFFADLSRSLSNSASREVFVFIHGYNVSFSSAVLYTSQLAWDWGFNGVPVLYSWASSGTLLGYPKDEESVRLTESHLRWFLSELLTKTSAKNVHLIAHSMGNRALTEVLRSFVAETNQPLFGEVILAAPDMNRIGFLQDVAQSLPKVARHVTLYSSSEDKAMKASKSFHQYARAGDAGTEPVVCEGIDTIDASQAETDLLGHSYLLNARAVIGDMADVICRGLPPEQRNLTRVENNGHSYWKLKHSGANQANSGSGAK